MCYSSHRRHTVSPFEAATVPGSVGARGTWKGHADQWGRGPYGARSEGQLVTNVPCSCADVRSGSQVLWRVLLPLGAVSVAQWTPTANCTHAGALSYSLIIM